MICDTLRCYTTCTHLYKKAQSHVGVVLFCSFLFFNHMNLLSFIDSMVRKVMVNKNLFLLTPENIQTPKFLWYKTNSTSRLSPK